MIMSTGKTLLVCCALSLLALVRAQDIVEESTVFEFDDDTRALENENGRLAFIGEVDNSFLSDNTIGEFSLQPGAIVQPHMHPRATEVLRVLKGTFRVCFVQELGLGANRFCNDVTEGQVTVFPVDTIHYQQNIGSEPALSYSVFTTGNPGVFFFPLSLFQLPSEALSASFDLSLAEINDIRTNTRATVPAIPAAQGADLAPTVDEAIARSNL